MVRKSLFVFLFFLSLPAAHASQGRIGVSYDKISTLVFDEEIVDVELGSQAYHVKVKGKYLLLRAKSKEVAPTSLFVRYGNKPQHCYVTEIFPDAEASLQYLVQAVAEEAPVEPKQEKPTTLFTDVKQEYFDIGIIRHGARIILNKILHTEDSTHIQVSVENTSSIDLCLEQHAFEYVTVLSKGIFRRKSKRRLAKPITAFTKFTVPANSAQYVVFSVPTYMSTSGLEISLEERDGEHRFEFLIPSKVLLKAKKRKL